MWRNLHFDNLIILLPLIAPAPIRVDQIQKKTKVSLRFCIKFKSQDKIAKACLLRTRIFCPHNFAWLCRNSSSKLLVKAPDLCKIYVICMCRVSFFKYYLKEKKKQVDLHWLSYAFSKLKKLIYLVIIFTFALLKIFINLTITYNNILRYVLVSAKTLDVTTVATFSDVVLLRVFIFFLYFVISNIDINHSCSRVTYIF